MSSSQTISDNTMKQSETNQAAILNNIKQLQMMEADLYTQLESSTASGANDSEQETIINKINELSTMRMTMFGDLDITFKTTQDRVAQSRTDLVDQLTTTRIMERELNNSKTNLNQLQTTKANKMRMVQINTYYASKYKAQIDVMKTIIIVCVPLFILAIISKKSLAPDNITKSLMGVIIVIGSFFIIKQIYDLTSRDNMNFDEYDWMWDSSNTPVITEYDKTITTPTPEFSISGCVGSECCSTGMYYSAVQGQCLTGSKIPTTDDATTLSKTEGFAQGRKSNAFVESVGTTCPFKQMNTVVKPFNETHTNYVNVSAF
jgi:hypothetical protein